MKINEWHPLVLLLTALMLGGCNDFTQVSTGDYGAFEAAVATSDSGIAIAWYDNRHGNDEIYLRTFNGKLQPLTDEMRITTSAAASYEADVAPLESSLAIAWYEREPSGKLQVHVGAWTPAGDELWRRTPATAALNSRVPVLESVDDTLFIAWIEEAPGAEPQPSGAEKEAPDTDTTTIYGAWLNSAGSFLYPPFAIAPASLTTWNLNTGVLPDGRVALVFDARFETRNSELYLALIDKDHVNVARLSADDGFASTYPDIAAGAPDIAAGAPNIAAGANRVAVSWQERKDGNDEVYLALMDLATLPATDVLERNATRITRTAGESIGAYLAWNGPVLGLAWNDDSAGQHDIWFQSFDESGVELHAQRRLTNTPEDSRIPSIAANGDGFVLAWSETSSASGGHGGNASKSRSKIVAMQVK